MKYDRLTKKGGLDFADKNLSLADEWGYSHIYNRLAELEDKIEQGKMIELPRVLRYVDYEYAIEKFVVQWQVNGRIKQKSYFSEKNAYHRLKELQNG